MFKGNLDSEAFLASMIDEGTATVSTKELRSLLQNYRASVREVAAKNKQIKLLQSKIVSITYDLDITNKNKLVVTGIDVRV